MSRWPWPQSAVRIVLDSPLSLQRLASRIAAAMACVGSGAGTMPWVRANISAAWKHSSCGIDSASARPSS